MSPAFVRLVTSEVDGNGVRCHHEVRPTNEQNVPKQPCFRAPSANSWILTGVWTREHVSPEHGSSRFETQLLSLVQIGSGNWGTGIGWGYTPLPPLWLRASLPCRIEQNMAVLVCVNWFSGDTECSRSMRSFIMQRPLASPCPYLRARILFQEEPFLSRDQEMPGLRSGKLQRGERLSAWHHFTLSNWLGYRTLLITISNWLFKCPFFVMIWNSLFCFCLCFCIFIIFHHQYYSVPHSVSSCTCVPQSRLCVSVRSEPQHIPSLCLHYSVISKTLVFSKNFVRFSFSGISCCFPYLHRH